MGRNFVFGRVLLFLFVIHAKSDTTKHHRNELSEKHLKKKTFLKNMIVVLTTRWWPQWSRMIVHAWFRFW